MSPKLSIIVPSIRKQGLMDLADSVDIPNTEMIAVGTVRWLKWRGIDCIQSYRSPNACQQLGLTNADGDYITFAADDGVFIPGALKRAFDYMNELNTYDFVNYKTIFVGKYLEGDNPHPDMSKNEYYRFKYHKAYRMKGIPQDALIFNCGLISRKFILELGGWDCSFQATTCAHADLGIRALQAGANMILMDEPLFKCSHQPGKTGDHKPIHEAMKEDLKMLKKLYSKPRQTNIDLYNFEKTPAVWKRFL